MVCFTATQGQPIFFIGLGSYSKLTCVLSEARSCGTTILVKSLWSLTYRPIVCDEQVLSLQIPSSLLQLGCQYTAVGGREISWCERKPDWCCALCVYVSTEESFIFLVLRVTWPKLVLIFVFHCFSSMGMVIYIDIVKLYCVWSFWMVSSRKSITAGCVIMYICIQGVPGGMFQTSGECSLC